MMRKKIRRMCRMVRETRSWDAPVKSTLLADIQRARALIAELGTLIS